jgi:trehalose utilization protein
VNNHLSRRSFLNASAAGAAGILLGQIQTSGAATAKAKPVVVCWSEGTAPKKVYPKDINTCIAEGLRKSLPNWEVVEADISQADQGLPEALLNRCDVLIWWGHKKHGKVDNKLTDRIVKRVTKDGMGFLSLHSAHFAKPNIKLMSVMKTDPALLKKVRPANRVAAWGTYKGDSLTLKIKVLDKKHPIAKDVKDFTVEHHERYSDPYAVPKPEAIVFSGDAKLKNGKIDTSQQGFCWTIGKGKMFYFQPGHETNPIFADKNVRKIMANAVTWAAPKKK